MLIDRVFKKTTIALPVFWLVFFAFLPFLLVFIASFLTQGDTEIFKWHFNLSNYWDLLNPIYLKVFLRSLYLAAITTVICLILAYPFAYIVARKHEKWRPILIFLLILPFWTSSLIRTYALIILIRSQGLLNKFLFMLGIIHQPIQLLYTQGAVLIGLVYSLLPFMILPLFANLEKFDWRLMEAAQDLSATKWRILSRIVIPITKPGIVAGIILVFFPAMTMFYIPNILGGVHSLLLGNLIQNQFISTHNWPMGSATSVILTLLMGIFLVVYFKLTTPKERTELMG
ncbi:MAG: ABC transporter permease subunit [Gammaproteobacteria bacterium]|nr:ABC transporter permease subunit [Gammaproteobacteria bacterium]